MKPAQTATRPAKTRIERIRTLFTRILAICIFVSCLFFYNGWDATEGLRIYALIFNTIGFFLAGIGAIGRIWCSVYIAGYKTQKLVTSGPYSMTRNPLYFFSFIGAVGVGLVSETLTIPLLIAIGFALYYPPVMRAEEARLTAIHGPAYRDYCARVPLFWPQLDLLRESKNYAVNAKIIREHLVSAIWFVWAPVFFELIETIHELGLPHLFILW